MPPAAADPFEPTVNVADFLHLQSNELEARTITYAAGTASAPSQRQVRWLLPPVGLLSRIYIDVDGGSTTAYDFTAGGGTGAVPASLLGPWSVVENISLRVNGGVALVDVSGFGAMLLAASEPFSAPIAQAAGFNYTTSPNDVENTIYNYDPTQDHRPRFSFEVPLSFTPGQPLGMVLAGNDQTTIELVVTLGSLDKYALLSGGTANAALSLTFTPNVEYFAVPEPEAFDQWVRPLLGYAHVAREFRQDVTTTGAQAVTLDNHDSILQVLHTPVLNSILNMTAFDRLRFILNRSDYRHDDGLATHLRKQRRAFGGKDLPCLAWNFWEGHSLRDAIRADAYTDIRSELTISSGTTIGTAYINTLERKLVQLDS